MWKNSLKKVESDKNKILYETLLDFLQRNVTYFLNKSRVYIYVYIYIYIYIYNILANSTERGCLT